MEEKQSIKISGVLIGAAVVAGYLALNYFKKKSTKEVIELTPEPVQEVEEATDAIEE